MLRAGKLPLGNPETGDNCRMDIELDILLRLYLIAVSAVPLPCGVMMLILKPGSEQSQQY